MSESAVHDSFVKWKESATTKQDETGDFVLVVENIADETNAAGTDEQTSNNNTEEDVVVVDNHAAESTRASFRKWKLAGGHGTSDDEFVLV